MKFALNLLLILVTLFNQAIVSRPVSYAPVHSQAQTAVEIPVPTPASGASTYPPPVSATPTPMPTSIPTAVPASQPVAVPAPATAPTQALVSRLSLKTNLNCAAPGEDLSLDWDFQPAAEWEGRESSLELVLSLPMAFTPDSKDLSHFDAQSGAARLPLSKTGKIQGKLAQDKMTPGTVTLAAKVVDGEKLIAAASLRVGPGGRFEIAAKGGEAASPGGQIKVSFPEGALKEDVSVCVREIATSDHATPLFGGHSFEIDAQSKASGAAVKQFARDLEISYPYDPKKIGVDEASLSLVYYDEAAQRWKYLPSTVDTTRHVITGYSNHLTEFSYDLNSVDKYRIQDFAAFQVSEYSGAASYSYSLTVPPGPGGLAPNLTLTYSSAIPDSAGPHSQASWVGMGWELNPGAISRNTNGTLSLSDDTFSLQLSGQAGGMLLPIRTGTDTTVGSDTYNKAYIEYESQDATFLRIRRYGNINGPGCDYLCDTSFWRVWDQGGTVYTFAENQNYTPYFGSGAPTIEIAKWPLTQVKSISGQTIDYSYTMHGAGRDGNGGGYESYDELQLVLHEIRYANNHYLIHFEDEVRGDVDDDCVGNDMARCTVDVRRLDAISMYYNPDGDAAMAGLERIRRYDFTYVEGGTLGVFPNTRWTHENGVTGYTPTLVSIQEYGKENDVALPAMNFAYGDRMHLTEASNGYNGKIQFEYETTPWPNGAPLWANGTADGTPLKFWRWDYLDSSDILETGNMIFAGLAQRGSSLPAGRNIWMQMDVNAPTSGGVQFHVINGSELLAYSDYILTTNGAGKYSAILTLPLNLLDDTSYSLMYLCAKPCSIDSIQFGSVAARYRVTQKRIYPDASLEAHDTYAYQYTGPAMNDASLSSVTSSSDFTAKKVITPPYTELRGHAQVKMIRPDGSYTITNYHQTDRLAGKVSSSALYGADTHKLNETLYTYATPVELPVSSAASAYLPKYGDNPITKVDAKIWWTPLATVEKRIYASDGVNYIATKSDTSYVLDGNGKPVYGEVRAVVESENNGNGWTVVRKKFSTYTNTDVPAPGASNDLRYFVGHPSSTAVCSPNGSASRLEYEICGTGANDYYGFTAYTYNEKGQVSTTANLLYWSGAPLAAYLNGYSDFTQYTYDSYGNPVTVGQGYKAANAAGVVQKTTTSCYLAETANRTANPPCDPYSGVGVNGVYLSWVKNPLNQVTHYVNDARLG